MSKPRILADENIPRTAIQILRGRGYDVVSVWEISPGMSDEQIVQLAIRERRVIITFDKDFGRIALTNPGTPGVILLRTPPVNPEYIARRIVSALETVGNPYDKLIIVRKRSLRVIPLR